MADIINFSERKNAMTKKHVAEHIIVNLNEVLTWRGRPLKESFDKFREDGEDWTQEELKDGEHIGVRNLNIGNCLITALTRVIEQDKDETKNNQRSTVRRCLQSDKIDEAMLEVEEGENCPYVLSSEWVQIARLRTFKNGVGDIIYFTLCRIIDPAFIMTDEEKKAIAAEAKAAQEEGNKQEPEMDDEGE